MQIDPFSWGKVNPNPRIIIYRFSMKSFLDMIAGWCKWGKPKVHWLLVPFGTLNILSKVFKQSFWMRGFGARTAKRTTLWSNSTGVRFFATSKKAKGAKSSLKLADVYYDKSGRKRYKGNSNLRMSQSHPQFFASWNIVRRVKHLFSPPFPNWGNIR